jgi:GDP-4-dehydro-6-deoxy-D-mannose reductase
MRAYVTGASGFVGTWLCRALSAHGATVIAAPVELDITEGAEVAAEVHSAAPDVIFHLAARAHAGESWDDPTATLSVNALGTLQVLEAAAACSVVPSVVLISSSEVYGPGIGDPLEETAPLRPVTPYAASKIAAEFLGLQAYLGRGVPVIRARPFNHIGPGQSDAFVVAALARRVAAAERAGGGAVRVGNLEAVRDFTDVRDVVEAYCLLAELGEPGEVYNICSGVHRSVAEILAALIRRAEVPVEVVVDPELVRPVEVPLIAGSARRIEQRTGWRAQIPLDETLDAVLADWRQRTDQRSAS